MWELTGNSLTKFELALRRIAEALTTLGQQYALVGGLAVGARAEPRFTQDIDIAIRVEDDEQAERLIQQLHSRGYCLISLVEQDAVGRLATARMQDLTAELVVDLLFASSGLESDIALAAEGLELFPDLAFPVARSGHLIASKILARDDKRRPQDRLDLKNLLSEASEADLELARRSVLLIQERGYGRGRDLASVLQQTLLEFTIG